MVKVHAGDRVQVLCKSSLVDGTNLDTDKARETPYWLRAVDKAGPEGASSGVVGMGVGERKTIVFQRPESREIHLDVEILAIKVRDLAS